MEHKDRRAEPNPQLGGPLHPAFSDAGTAELFGRAGQHTAKHEFGPAARLYKKILDMNPRHVGARDGLACVYLEQGKLERASEEFARLAVTAPQVLGDFGAAVKMLLRVQPRLAHAFSMAFDAWPQLRSAEDLLGPKGVAEIAGDPYLRSLLEGTIVRDLAMERVLTSLRASMLAKAVGEKPNGDSDILAFGGALAQQCFINEYVFAVSTQELTQLERLKSLLANAADHASTINPLWIVTLAMYEPLHELPQAEILTGQAWPAPVQAVVTQQIREPRQEHELRATIPSLTPIGGGVTAVVRQQYEENPYPRWVRLADPPAPIVLDDYIRHQFPTTPFRPTGKRDSIDILVAGCGTGRHALELAQSYRGAHVLAVDLSLASLASAKRRTPPTLAGSIEFAQADIFALSSIDRRFDLINVGGVLHHTDDALGAWRELIKLMAPNGLMQVGLYSAHARRDVVAARKVIAERGYGSTPEGIRRCRQDLLHGPAIPDYLRLNDFFSVSECRDLLFHVHERQFTIPEIKAFLVENDLKFIGFEFSPHELHVRYRSQFAANGWSTSDLDRWDAIERQHPLLFAAMYNFWIQKN